MRELQRACSEENRRCVGAKQNFDDFAKGLSVRMRNHSVNARLEYQPELGVMGTGYSVEVSFNNVHLGAPMSVDARGEVDAALTPFRARMENLTYASAVYADIQVHTEEPVAMRRDKARDNGRPGSCCGGVAYKGDSATRVYLGTVPVMVGSALCTTRTSGVGLQEELDPGGYFIIQGTCSRRVLVCVCAPRKLTDPPPSCRERADCALVSQHGSVQLRGIPGQRRRVILHRAQRDQVRENALHASGQTPH